MSYSAPTGNLAARMGGWSAKHWKSALLFWLVFVLGVSYLGSAVGTTEIATKDQNVGETRTADHLLAEAGFNLEPQDEYVIVQNRTADANDPAFRAVVADVALALKPFQPSYTRLQLPYAPSAVGQISKDGHTALIQFTMKGDFEHAKTQIDPVVAAVDSVQREHPSYYVAEVGATSTGKALEKTINKQLEDAGIRSIPLTLVVLLAVFGALVAAVIPIVLSLMAVIASLGVVAFASHAIPTDSNVSVIVLLIGLAVGVDYSLFYLKRRREERSAGRTPEDAIAIAAATSGRTILISGATVMIAMAGMLFSGDATFMSFSVGTISVVAVAMVASLTVLPALLSRLGDGVDRGRIPFVSRRVRANRDSRFWSGVVSAVMRRPAISATAATVALILLAIPALGLHTNRGGLDVMPADTPELAALHVLEKAFPGGIDAARLVVKAPDVTAPEVSAALDDLERAALRAGVIDRGIAVEANAAGTIARVDIPIVGTGPDEQSKRALATLRTTIVPNTIGRVPGAEYAVGGTTAASVDYTNAMKRSLPLVFVFVLGFAFLLLLASFRSLTIAVASIAMNLLSVAASYGVIVLVFQKTWAESILGFTSNGAVAPWIPLFLFVILFGLSMDYHVFILSRIREAHDRGQPTDEAVAHGIRTTAGVVTSAAVVMVGAFAIFATMPICDMKEMGIGLAVAVLLDATVVRGVLLPSIMKLLGERNWYLPERLSWLPKLEHENAAAPVPAPVLDAAA